VSHNYGTVYNRSDVMLGVNRLARRYKSIKNERVKKRIRLTMISLISKIEGI